MKETPKLIIVLTLISVLSGMILAYTFYTTNDKIIANDELKKQRAIAEVLPGLASYEIQQKGNLTYYQGYDHEKNSVGIAMEAVGGGFNGEIKLMIGVKPEESRITAIKVLSQLETPGLGARISESTFASNFTDKPFGEYQAVKRPASDPLEVSAISGATISSVAVINIIQTALKSVQEAFGGGQ